MIVSEKNKNRVAIMGFHEKYDWEVAKTVDLEASKEGGKE